MLVLGCDGSGSDDEPCAAARAPGVELVINTNAPEALKIGRAHV